MAKVIRRSVQYLKNKVVHKTHRLALASGKVSEDVFAHTDDNTATVVYKIPVDENEAVRVLATTIAQRSTGAEAIRSDQTHAFRREADGNVTAISTATSVTVNDSNGTPTLTLVANTSDQTVDVVVTGETSKEFNWNVYVEYQKVIGSEGGT